MGDIPYSQDEEARFPGLIAEMNGEELAFAVHVGDFKSPVVTCTDELYLERLDKLRELFFMNDTSLGQRRINVVRQSRSPEGPGYPEHSRWEHQGVLFLTLNAPGSNNFPEARGEFAARSAAVRRWVTESFAIARGRGLRGIVVFMQGDPWNSAGQPRRGFAALLESLAAVTRNFSGEVLLVNGDTHRYRVDRPLRDSVTGGPIENFLRVVVFGSPWMNWVRVRVREQDGRVRFEVTPGS